MSTEGVVQVLEPTLEEDIALIARYLKGMIPSEVINSGFLEEHPGVSSLEAYAEYVHGYKPQRHHKQWMQVLSDPDELRVLIIAPPGWAKTQTLVEFVAWMTGRAGRQSFHTIYISNTGPQANNKSVAIRDTIALNPKYAEVFPDVKPDYEKGWGEREWFVERDDVGDKDATVLASGVGGPILGARADLLVFDDISDMENTATKAQREKVRTWIQTTAMTRLDPVKGKAVCIMARWHAEDAAGYFIADGWRVIHLPALDDQDQSTWEDRHPTERLRELRSKMPLVFNRVFQGRPTKVAVGALWKAEWIESKRVAQWPRLHRIVIPVDPAVTSGESSADTGIVPVGAGWCSCNGEPAVHYFVLDDRTCHLSPAGWAQVVVGAYLDYEADRVVGEVNNGGDLVESNIKTINPSVAFKAVHASRGKLVRAEPVASLYEQGKVHHCTGANLGELEEQLLQYSPGTGQASPDRLDSLVWGLTELMGGAKVATQSLVAPFSMAQASKWRG